MSGVSDRRRISKKNAYLSADRPAITIQYDRIDGNTMPYPTLYGGTPFLYQPMGMGMPVMYNAATGNIPPPPPIVYDEKTGNIPPPPPMVYNEATGNIPPPPIVYDEKAGNIPPPPPMEHDDQAGVIPPPPPPTTGIDSITTTSQITATVPHTPATAATTATPPIHYNFDYESKLTEEDLVLPLLPSPLVRQLEDCLRDQAHRGGPGEAGEAVRPGRHEVRPRGEKRTQKRTEGRAEEETCCHEQRGRGREGRVRHVQPLRWNLQVGVEGKSDS